MPTAAKASFSSNRSMSETAMPSLAAAFSMARAGCSWSVESGPATWPEAPISASQVRPSSSALALLMTTTAARAVGDLGRRAGGDRAVLGDRAQPGEGLDRGVAADALVLGDREVALARADRHRHDLVVEDAVLPGQRGPLVGLGGERVLLLAGQVGAGALQLSVRLIIAWSVDWSWRAS